MEFFKLVYIYSLIMAIGSSFFVGKNVWISLFVFWGLYSCIFILSPGGYDVDIYEEFVLGIDRLDLIDISDFFDTEYYLYPFLYMAKVFGGPVLLYFGISIIILQFFFRYKSEGRAIYDRAMLAVYVSSAMPFLFTNVIRQAYAVIFLIFLFQKLDRSIKLENFLYSLVTHRSSLIFLVTRVFRSKLFLIACSMAAILLAYSAYEYLTANVVMLEVYSRIHAGGGENSAGKLILRCAAIALPFYIVNIFSLQRNLINENIQLLKFVEYIILPTILIIAYKLNYKIADRYSYYYVFIYAVRASYFKEVDYLFYIASSSFLTVFLIIYGAYNDFWKHVF